MTFQAPSFLYALGLLAIPIIIHLFSFYVPKKLVFTNVKLLKELKEENKRTSQVKSWFLLLLRCLALAAIILAFAEPVIPTSKNAEKFETLGIYMDNSFSMASGSIQESNFYAAKGAAKDWVAQLPPTQEYFFANNQGAQPKKLSKQEVLDAIDQTDISAKGGNWGLVDQLKQRAKKDLPVLVLSDFQQSNFKENPPLADSSRLILYQLQGQINNNVSIDSVSINTPSVKLNQEFLVEAWLTNYGEKSIENLPVYLSVNNQSKAPSTVNLEPGEKAKVEFGLNLSTAGWMEGRVYIEDYPITYDNQLLFSFFCEKQSSVVLFNEIKAPKALNKLFGRDQDFLLTKESWKQFNALPFQQNNNTIILYAVDDLPTGNIEILKSYVANGGNLCLVLGPNLNITTYNNLFQALAMGTIEKKVDVEQVWAQLDHNRPFFAPLFEEPSNNNRLPKSKGYWKLKQSPNSTPVISFNNQDPVLTKGSYQSGNVFIYTSFADDFENNGLFAPIFLRITEYSNASHQWYAMLGKENSYELGLSDTTGGSQLILEREGKEFLPAINRKGNLSVFLNNLPLQEGFYLLKSKNQPLATLALNNNREESEIAFLNTADLERILPKSDYNTQYISGINGGKNASAAFRINDLILWPYFIVGALFFLLCEMLWIKWQKRQQ